MRCSQGSPRQILTAVMMRIIVDKSIDHAKPNFDFFFTTISTSKKMFFSELELKKALRDTLDSYQQWQISQSDCKISSNCGRIVL